MNEISLREGLTLLKEAYCEDLYELFAEEEDIDKIVAEAEELKAEKENNNE